MLFQRVAIGFALIALVLRPLCAQDTTRVRKSDDARVSQQAKASIRNEALNREWKAIVKEHPRFAAAFLAQQVILAEEAAQGSEFVRSNMKSVADSNAAVLFSKFWLFWSNRPIVVNSQGLLACLQKNGYHPDKCISLPHDDWFEDPFHYQPHLPG